MTATALEEETTTIKRAAHSFTGIQHISYMERATKRHTMHGKTMHNIEYGKMILSAFSFGKCTHSSAIMSTFRCFIVVVHINKSKHIININKKLCVVDIEFH